ncbi:MAG: four helix bundle protein, partial [Chloroflexi bacterium]|nr:four helix bundle protein [Chloroflexota bacterium]
MALGNEYNFRKLILWQKAQGLTLDVIKLTSALPRANVADALVRQIVRSSSSIAANVAEGHGRFTPRAHAYHLSIAKGSACETDGWLDLLRRSGHISAEQEQPLHDVCMELIAMLTAKIRELEKLPARSLGEERATYITNRETF